MHHTITRVTKVLIYFVIFQSMLYGNILNVPSEMYPTIQSAIDSSQAGDTVLVQSGIYQERINLIGKSIVLASLYLTTDDTAYISQTVIDGSGSGSVVTFETAEDSSTQLVGFTVKNGLTFSGGGGGIYCSGGSSPLLKELIINQNSAANGSGIFCFQASPRIENCTIKNNTSFSIGGGVYASQNSNLLIRNSEIRSNSANNDGGGIYVTDGSTIVLEDVNLHDNISFSGAGIYLRRDSDVLFTSGSISNNYAEDFGGAIYCRESRISIINSIIERNEGFFGGGGIYAERASYIRIENTRVLKNRTPFDGGGIFADNSSIVLRSSALYENGAGGNGGAIYSVLAELNVHGDSLSSIYTNYAGFDGSDLYFTTADPISVQLDTFTVSGPDDYYIYPHENITLSINQAKLERVDNDLYISATGDNANDGLSPETPLRSISYALLKIVPDTLQQRFLHLMDGIYSLHTNDEFFPLRLPSQISLKGFSTAGTVLNAEFKDRVIIARDNRRSAIENLTVSGGNTEFGAGVYLSSAEITIKNVLISQNIGGFGSAIYCREGAKPFLLNSTVANNFINEDFVGQELASGFYSIDSDPVLVNSIFWENEQKEISLDRSDGTNNLVVIASDIQDGLAGIIRAPNDSVYWLEGNIESDPLFTDTTVRNFNLLNGSPCIDSGVNDTIFVYNSNIDSIRIPELSFLGMAPDMGAFEFSLTNILSASETLPHSYRLFQNYPNPFNPQTKIPFSLPNSVEVTLTIYDISGQLVTTLISGYLSAGNHEVFFNGKDYSSGQYFYFLSAGTYSKTGRMILLK